MEKYEVILGLGSNVGDREANLNAAIELLGEYLQDIRRSQVLESAALLPENAPAEWDMPFFNMAVAGKTSLSPRELLAAVKQIEANLGRNKIGHWSPRSIDIDILAFGDLVVDEDDLEIPHAELLKRDFALMPLLELAPNWVHPLFVKKNSPTANHLLTTTKLVGIVNVTPDSFSDGGKNFSAQQAIAAIQEMVAEGAEIIDIGAESTRPNATPVSAIEELDRLAPVLSAIKDIPAIISIDTRHAETARKALAMGAQWINDVSGFENHEMIAAVQQSDSKIVVMHSLTVPADKAVVFPEDSDVVAEVLGWAEAKIAAIEAAGIKRARIIFDVGIGFGKTAAQSQKLVENIARFKALEVPLFVGHSRKSFLGAKTVAEADAKTLEISRFLASQGVDYLRVHNVKLHRSLIPQYKKQA